MPKDANPCIWMTAGIVSYKLCDRFYECAGCALDAGLRGVTCAVWPGRGPDSGGPAWRFPDDRQYSSRHVWFFPTPAGTVRIGLDALASLLIGPVSNLSLECEGGKATRSAPVARISCRFGLVGVGSPLDGVVATRNRRLDTEPGLLSSSPYDEGWLVEITPSAGESGGPDEGLVAADVIRTQARHDLQRFRRQLGMLLLAGMPEGVGPTMADGGSRLDDVALMVGPSRFLELVQGVLG